MLRIHDNENTEFCQGDFHRFLEQDNPNPFFVITIASFNFSPAAPQTDTKNAAKTSADT